MDFLILIKNGSDNLTTTVSPSVDSLAFLAIPEIAASMADPRFVAKFHIIESPWMPFKDSVSIDYSGHENRVLTATTLPFRRGRTSFFNTIVVDP
jgi:hypothetical protein